MAGITHPFVSAIADGADATLLRPSNWNAEHTVAAWEDIRVEPQVKLANPTTNNPTFEKWFDDTAGTSRGVFLHSFEDGATPKEVFFNVQMPHAWNGGAISPHVHWIPADTTTDQKIVVRWGLEYNWTDIGQVFAADTTVVYANALVPDDADLVAYKHYISEFADITPSATQDGLSSVLMCRLFRDSNNALDTYENKAGLLYFDIHYQLDSVGSDDEYAK